jgi:Zn-finger nucleic acid-binding protein
MLCPVCQVELSITDRQGIEVDFCPKCRGVWLDRGELDKLIERSAQSDTHAMSQRYRDGRDDFVSDYDDDDGYKPKNDERYRGDERAYPPGRKKKSFLSNMFDIFD